MKKGLVILLVMLGLAGCNMLVEQPYTLEVYNEIRLGQELAEVFGIMARAGAGKGGGSGPVNVSTSGAAVPVFRGKKLEFEALVFQSVMWQNPNGSNILVMFKNGKVHTMAQAGLR